MSNRVLVVDDEPMLCELIHDVLTSAEIEAVPISNSAQASILLLEEKFDAVFLDIRMPAPDGLELARQIRTSGLNQTTPIVMITGEEDRAVHIACILTAIQRPLLRACPIFGYSAPAQRSGKSLRSKYHPEKTTFWSGPRCL